MERDKHGPLPGVTSGPPRRGGERAAAQTSVEPERYDPFNAG